MHRMPEPDAVQGVGEAIAGAAQRVEGMAEHVLEPVARPIQPFLTSDEGQQPRPPLPATFWRHLNHGISPSSITEIYSAYLTRSLT
jgi:hypothetical protein